VLPLQLQTSIYEPDQVRTICRHGGSVIAALCLVCADPRLPGELAAATGLFNGTVLPACCAWSSRAAPAIAGRSAGKDSVGRLSLVSCLHLHSVAVHPSPSSCPARLTHSHAYAPYHCQQGKLEDTACMHVAISVEQLAFFT
jgi:hypothetical protein